MEEIWKPIKINKNGICYDLTGKYDISNLGNVRNSKSGKYLKQRVDKLGYFVISLRLNSKRTPKVLRIHRLVAITFLPNYNNLPQVNHIDGNKLNNNITNLEWCTSSHNMKHAYENNLIDHTKLETYRQKATAKVSIKVNQYTQNGEFLRTYDSYLQAAKAVGVSSNAIKKCCNGQQRTSAGYIWRCP